MNYFFACLIVFGVVVGMMWALTPVGTPSWVKMAFLPMPLKKFNAVKAKVHPWVGKVAMRVRMDGCMAHISTVENIGVIKEVYWQDERIPGAHHLQIVSCGDTDGRPDFTILLARSTWIGNHVLIERY